MRFLTSDVSRPLSSPLKTPSALAERAGLLRPRPCLVHGGDGVSEASSLASRHACEQNGAVIVAGSEDSAEGSLAMHTALEGCPIPPVI